MKHWRARLLPYIKNVALDLGLLAGHDDYTRFIILGRSRSGSNFLRGLLNSHSQIVALGELFQNKQAIGWAYPGYQQGGSMVNLFHNEPVRFIETRVFRRFPKAINAVGFKIFYYHAQDVKWKPVWKHLVDQTSLRIIHIKRRNILRTHLSRKQAGRTDAWVNTTGSSDSRPPEILDYDECLKDFQQTRTYEEQNDKLFQGHPLTDVFYEDLADDYRKEMLRIQEFLGVVKEDVKPQTFKQSSQPLSQAIANYAQLKARFAGSQWASFFED
jgi:LPS sulfotransferase NodH